MPEGKAAQVTSEMRRFELVLAKVDGTGLEERDY